LPRSNRPPPAAGEVRSRSRPRERDRAMTYLSFFLDSYSIPLIDDSIHHNLWDTITLCACKKVMGKPLWRWRHLSFSHLFSILFGESIFIFFVSK
jgi:hypothetical protein